MDPRRLGIGPFGIGPFGVGPFDVVVTDLDRTFTGLDLALDPRSLAAARRLRQAGIPCILATGRRAQDLAGWPELQEAFDGFVLECGAVWGRWGGWRLASPHTTAVRSVAVALAAQGCGVEEGHASCSVPADWRARVEASPERPLLSLQPNRDRIDVVGAGVDKAVGLRLLLDEMGLAGARILSIGDGENDLPVFAAADHAVAVPNAADAVRAAADAVAPEPAADGFVWMAERLLEGRSGGSGDAGGSSGSNGSGSGSGGGGDRWPPGKARMDGSMKARAMGA